MHFLQLIHQTKAGSCCGLLIRHTSNLKFQDPDYSHHVHLERSRLTSIDDFLIICLRRECVRSDGMVNDPDFWKCLFISFPSPTSVFAVVVLFSLFSFSSSAFPFPLFLLFFPPSYSTLLRSFCYHFQTGCSLRLFKSP